jgi:von Hippel-Lindau disease tumor supressor
MERQIESVVISVISTGLLLCLHSSVYAQSEAVLLKPQSCSSEPQLRSSSSLLSTNVQFVNIRSSPVKVYWIDFAGKRQHYFDLEPNQVRWQQTFTSHPWIITDSGANQPCLTIFLPPSRVDGFAIID